jgi:hypothetical protein
MGYKLLHMLEHFLSCVHGGDVVNVAKEHCVQRALGTTKNCDY